MRKSFFIKIFLVVISLLFIICLSGCNKQIFDVNQTYTKAITYLGGERIELEIKKWNDYDGEQIQIVTKDGDVYLLSMNNTMLIYEKED